MTPKEEYKSYMDRQHAPQQLLDQTLEKIHEQCASEPDEPARPSAKIHNFPTKWVALAASVAVLIISGVAIRQWASTPSISYSPVAASEFSTNLTLGTAQDAVSPEEEDSFTFYSVSEKGQLPQGILDGKPYTLGGEDVYWGYDTSTDTRYAVYHDETTWQVYEAHKISKKDFYKKVKQAIQ